MDCCCCCCCTRAGHLAYPLHVSSNILNSFPPGDVVMQVGGRVLTHASLAVCWCEQQRLLKPACERHYNPTLRRVAVTRLAGSRVLTRWLHVCVPLPEGHPGGPCCHRLCGDWALPPQPPPSKEGLGGEQQARAGRQTSPSQQSGSCSHHHHHGTHLSIPMPSLQSLASLHHTSSVLPACLCAVCCVLCVCCSYTPLSVCPVASTNRTCWMLCGTSSPSQAGRVPC